MQRDQVLVGPMSVAELREAIERPAHAVGMELEPGLTELLLRDIGAREAEDAGPASGAYEAGRLPLIAYALQETWQHRAGGTLTVAGYQGTGGIHHAIANTAERTFAALPEAGQQAAQPLFLRLVKIGDGTQDTRRNVSEAELLRHGPAGTGAEQVLAAFTQARLLTSNQDGIEISHEALLEAWPRLRQWISSDRAGNLVSQELEDAATAWERSGHDNSALLRGSRLDAAIGWTGERFDRGHVSLSARDFLQESRRQQTRASQVRRAAVVVLAVVALVAASTAWFAFAQRSTAEASTRQAILNQVTAEADQLRPTNASLAAELDALAYRMKPAAATYTKLISDENIPLSTVLAVPSGSAGSVAFSPDGRTLAAATGAGVLLWDVSDPSHPRVLGGPLSARSAFDSVSFSPAGGILAGATGSSVLLWDVADPSQARQLGSQIGPLPYVDGHPSSILSVTFSPDGRTLVAGAADNDSHLWQVTNPSKPISLGRLHSDTDSVTSVSFSRDGDILATGSADDTISLWNTAFPAATQLMYAPLAGHTGAVLDVAMSPDGNVLATASTDHTIRLWNIPRTVIVTGQTNYIDAMALSRTRGVLASGSPDGTVRLFNVTNPAAPALLSAAIRYPASYNGLSFSADGLVLAAATSGTSVNGAGVVQLWQTADPRHPTLLGKPLTGFSKYVATVAFSPDGRTLAAGSFDGTIRLWNVANPADPTSLGASLTGFAAGVESVAFSPNGRILAAGSLDGTIRLWNIANPAHPVLLGAPLTSPPLTGHTDTVHSLAFSPDGRTLASGSFDETIRLWDVADPARPQAIGGPVTGSENYINVVVFGPGGHTLMGADGDFTVRIWNLSAAAATRYICTSTENVLTPAQWHTYVPELPYAPPCGTSP